MGSIPIKHTSLLAAFRGGVEECGQCWNSLLALTSVETTVQDSDNHLPQKSLFYPKACSRETLVMEVTCQKCLFFLDYRINSRIRSDTLAFFGGPGNMHMTL